MINKKRLVRSGAAVAIVGSVLIGAFAYFTDYDSRELTAKAGNLSIDISKDTTDLTNGLGIVNPGDSNPLTFTVTNTGEKSVDIKAVMTVSAPQAFSDDHEYKITAIDGTELTGVLSTDKKSIVYTVADVALVGSVEDDTTLDGTESSHVYDYKFVFDEDVDNTWQDVEGTVEVEVFAKQHRNTDGLGNDWVSIVDKQ